MPDTLKSNVLKDIKVLELTSGASGAYAGRLLACSGAKVTKLIKKTAPISAYRDSEKCFIVLNNWESIIDKLQLLLKEDWDIVIWDNHIKEINTYLRDYASKQSSTINICLNFPEGTDINEELSLQAKGGWMRLTGSPDKPPLAIGGSPATHLVGAHAATAGSLGLIERKWSHRGGFITICALTITASSLEGLYSDYLATGINRTRPGNRHHSIAPMSILPAIDGWVLVGASVNNQWELLKDWAELPDVKGWQSEKGRKQNRLKLENHLSRWTSSHRRDDLFINGQTFRLPFAKVQCVNELKNCPQLKHRKFLRHSEYGRKTISLPWKVKGNSVVGQSTFRPFSWNNIKMLDLTNMWSGPYCTRLFADLGVEVIKVEAPHRPDGIRAGEDSSKPFFRELNRNKKGIQLDLRLREDRNKLLEMVRNTDILIENFSPRVMRNFGLDPDTLWRYQPTLGIISLSAFGQTGPYQNFVGYGPTLEAMSGVASLTHYDDGIPLLPGFSISDIGAGVHGAFALATILYQKFKQDAGFSVDLSQYETACQFVSDDLMDQTFEIKKEELTEKNDIVDLVNNYQILDVEIPGGTPVLGPPWYKKGWEPPHGPPPSLHVKS